VKVGFYYFGCRRPATVDAVSILIGVFTMHRSKKVSSFSPSEAHKQAQTSSATVPVSERKFLRAKDGADYLSISKSHFHALVKNGVLPQGKLISGAIRVWRREELEEAANKMWEVC
jgi:predicted DNA-binding transcriptional regulator AlpA